MNILDGLMNECWSCLFSDRGFAGGVYFWPDCRLDFFLPKGGLGVTRTTTIIATCTTCDKTEATHC